MTTAQFRLDFPEFSDTVRYPDSMLTLYLNLATAMVNPKRWGTQTNFGIELYIAHEVTLAAINQAQANSGGNPGSNNGIVNSKTIGSATVAYDTVSIAEKNGGFWNQTAYGRQFYRLLRMFGAGAIQL